MNADEKSRYFQELSRNLRHEGLTVKPETEEGLLPVELDGQRLCLAGYRCNKVLEGGRG